MHSMSAPRGIPTPRSSLDDSNERKVSTAVWLRKKIRSALDRTVQGIVGKYNQDARCFLAKYEYDNIFERDSLAQLFAELLGEDFHGIGPSGAHGESGPSRTPIVFDHHTDNTIVTCIEATVGIPSRRALLALLLYQKEEPLLQKFVQWVTSRKPDIPSDDSMPFTAESLEHYGVDGDYHRDILDTQAMFRPVVLRQQADRILRPTERLPFVGAPSYIKHGSSGIVSNVEIAQGYWEIESVDGRFVPGNSEGPTVVAIKTFMGIQNERDMEATTADFKTELDILRRLGSRHIKHDRIMLDLGSITILDEMSRVMSHTLIFPLAQFNLADFLQDNERYERYTIKSLVLSSFIDIVDAVACLHNNLATMHLDIKPENILVFENGTSHSENRPQDQHGLVLKLTDFGLARNINGRQRTGYSIDMSHRTSRPSATPAVRSAGTYQGPEIQGRNSSYAGRGTDIWPLGCIALMVMAFVLEGETGVSKLQNKLELEFMPRGGCEYLFYARSDTDRWETARHYQYSYLTDFTPDVADIPGLQPQCMAAVHPQVIAWSNRVYQSHHPPDRFPRQPLIKDWFEVIFRSALLIDHSRRSSASDLVTNLRAVQEGWELFERLQNAANFQPNSSTEGQHSLSRSEQIPSLYVNTTSATPVIEPPLPNSPHPPAEAVAAPALQHSLPPPVTTVVEPALQNPPHIQGEVITGPELRNTGSVLQSASHQREAAADVSAMRDSPNPAVAPTTEPGLQNLPYPIALASALSSPHSSRAPGSSSSSALFTAIEKDDAGAVDIELRHNPDLLEQRRPGFDEYPLHYALKRGTYEALKALLEKADHSVTDLKWSGRTLLQQACQKDGDVEALKCIRQYRAKFHFPWDVYINRRSKIGKDARVILEDIYKLAGPKPKKRGLLRT